MQLHLIDGQFTGKDALDLISKLVQVKIKFHEDRIQSSTNEEDIKMREKKIRHIQNQLQQLREDIGNDADSININTIINIDQPILTA